MRARGTATLMGGARPRARARGRDGVRGLSASRLESACCRVERRARAGAAAADDDDVELLARLERLHLLCAGLHGARVVTTVHERVEALDLRARPGSRLAREVDLLGFLEEGVAGIGQTRGAGTLCRPLQHRDAGRRADT